MKTKPKYILSKQREYENSIRNKAIDDFVKIARFQCDTKFIERIEQIAKELKDGN